MAKIQAQMMDISTIIFLFWEKEPLLVRQKVRINQTFDLKGKSRKRAEECNEFIFIRE